jgi:hypothetical protein
VRVTRVAAALTVEVNLVRRREWPCNFHPSPQMNGSANNSAASQQGVLKLSINRHRPREKERKNVIIGMSKSGNTI